MLASQ